MPEKKKEGLAAFLDAKNIVVGIVGLLVTSSVLYFGSNVVSSLEAVGSVETAVVGLTEKVSALEKEANGNSATIGIISQDVKELSKEVYRQSGERGR
jgi:hypothetical protein